MKARRAPHRRSADRQAPVVPATQAVSSSNNRYLIWVCVALVLATLAVYAQTATHAFIRYDDDVYVYNNPTVRAGLTASGIAWAFTTFSVSNWHPLTWLSLMLDCQLFGLNAGYHHLVSVGLHLASAILLLLVLVRATGRLWPSAMVAAIFALHPAHVESVAWVAERKDVLSAFFGILTLWLYLKYVEAPTFRRYFWVLLAFALGLMAKPMLVTLPFILLLLDYWPLGRWTWPPAWPALRSLLWEKLPLLALAAIDSLLTFEAQRNYGAVQSLEQWSFSARLANAIVAYACYLGKAVWPVDLGVLYPIHDVAAGSVFAAALLLLVCTAGAVWRARQRPYVLVGWLWFLGTLVPVIGLVQVGAQAMADRYTYLPFVGLSMAVVWWVADLVRDRPAMRNTAAAAALLVVILFAALTYRQTTYWKGSESLFEHTLAVTEGNYAIENNLGTVLEDEGRHAEATKHYLRSLAIRPNYGEAHSNLAHELLKQGQFDQAFGEFNEALRLAPNLYSAHAGIGVLLVAAGQLEEARAHLEQALRIAPAYADTQNNLCNVLGQLGRTDEAIAHCREALRLNPDFPDAHYNMGIALAAQGKKAEALAEFSKTLASNPSHAAARAAIQNLQK